MSASTATTARARALQTLHFSSPMLRRPRVPDIATPDTPPASQFGAGFEDDIRPDLSFTFAARIRHMSNAGLASSNPGVNTYFGLVGLTFR